MPGTCGVVHQLAVVLGKHPVVTLPIITHIQAVLQLLGVQFLESDRQGVGDGYGTVGGFGFWRFDHRLSINQRDRF